MVNAQQAPQGEKKKDNTLKIVLIVVGIVVGLMILAAVAMTVFVGSLFGRATKNVKVTSNGQGEGVTVKSSDGQTTSTYGTNAKLPDTWPSDIPIYSPSTIVAASKSGDSHYSASFKTNDSTDQVSAYYKQELPKQGWKNINESSYGDGTILSYKKNDRSLTFSVSNQANEDTEKTWVSLSTTTIPQ